MAAVLAGCSSGSRSNGSALTAPTVEVRDEPAGANCAGGGVAVLQGTDKDHNGMLAAAEVTSTHYVCGASTTGAQLVSARPIEPGKACPSGGVAIVSGKDADGDGMLSAAEVANTTTLCSTDTSAAAAPSTAMTGAVSIDMLAAGDAHCSSGGVAIHHGTDTNGNGTLDASEITSTDYACNGTMFDASTVCATPARWDAASGRCAVQQDWSGSDLPAANLGNLYLAGIDFSNAKLSKADLSWSDLRGANLTGADLSGANLSQALVSGANFTDAVLTGADLTGVDLRNATLDRTQASSLVACPDRLPNQWTCIDLGASGKTLVGPGTSLNGLDLTGANFSQANLSGVQVTGVAGCPAQLPPDWKCIDFPHAGKTLVGPGADLSALNLSAGDFSPATNLRGAIFTGAMLNGATFGSGSNLRDTSWNGSDLTALDLTNTNLQGASGHSLAACPTALPTSWSCVDLSGTVGKTLLGPGTDLQGLDLTGANLGGKNLSGSDLSGATLTNANLANANLSDANLQGAKLQNANLSGANLNHANLENATLTGANLSSAQLSDAKLQNADLSNADLSNADLSNADLSSANLTGAVLNGADLQNATLSGATLNGVKAAHLQNCPDTLPNQWTCKGKTLLGPGADLSGQNLTNLDFSGSSTHLNGANLSNTNLSNTDLSDANLTGANLSNANLTDTTLQNANLTNANLNGANLTGADLSGATVTSASSSGATWSNTKCPNGTTQSTACF